MFQKIIGTINLRRTIKKMGVFFRDKKFSVKTYIESNENRWQHLMCLFGNAGLPAQNQYLNPMEPENK